jgi:hypothetical protein
MRRLAGDRLARQFDRVGNCRRWTAPIFDAVLRDWRDVAGVIGDSWIVRGVFVLRHPSSI